MPKTSKKTIESISLPDFGTKNGRKFLAQSKKFADFPDLLHLQKQ